MEKKKQKRKPFKRVLLPLFLTIGALSTFSIATVNTFAFDGYHGNIAQTRSYEYWNALGGCEIYVSNDNVTYTVPMPNSCYANTSGRTYTYQPESSVTMSMDVRYYEDYQYQFLDIDFDMTSAYGCKTIELTNNSAKTVPWDDFLRQLNKMNVTFSQTGWTYSISFMAYDFVAGEFDPVYVETGAVDNFYNASRLTLDDIPTTQRNATTDGITYGVIRYLTIGFYNVNGTAVDSTFSLRYDDGEDIRNYQYVQKVANAPYGTIYKDSLGVFDFVEEFFAFEIFPNFRMSTMLALGLGVMCLSLFLKLAFGG